MNNEYNDNAIKVCNKYFDNITIEYGRYGFHFHDDTERRNVYNVVIESKNGKSYKFTFGDSIFNSRKGTKPEVYDVISCMQKYEVGTFREFCSEFGYDICDGIHWDVYNEVVREYRGFSALFENNQIPDDVLDII